MIRRLCAHTCMYEGLLTIEVLRVTFVILRGGLGVGKRKRGRERVREGGKEGL